jgi:hypothetical protein
MTELATTAVEVRSDGGTTATMSGEWRCYSYDGARRRYDNSNEYQWETRSDNSGRSEATTNHDGMEWSDPTMREEEEKDMAIFLLMIDRLVLYHLLEELGQGLETFLATLESFQFGDCNLVIDTINWKDNGGASLKLRNDVFDMNCLPDLFLTSLLT